MSPLNNLMALRFLLSLSFTPLLNDLTECFCKTFLRCNALRSQVSGPLANY